MRDMTYYIASLNELKLSLALVGKSIYNSLLNFFYFYEMIYLVVD